MFHKNKFKKLFLVYQFVVGHAIFLHQFLYAVDVFLGSTLADVYAHVMVFANGDFLQFHTDVITFCTDAGRHITFSLYA